jgi:L-threonylcarbamoyladenylate synthase
VTQPGQSRPATTETIDEAAALLRAAKLVAFPTETVYGLGADATDGEAVAAIFAAKGRPEFNPLIIHVASIEAAEMLVRFDDRARALAARFWPGALTLVLPRSEDCPVSLLAGAGLETLAVRVPGHPVAQALLTAAARPIAAPSANRSTHVSPTTAAHVADSLGDAVDLIVDGGACPVGIESTILDLVGETPVILRPGGVSAEDIEVVIGKVDTKGGTEARPRAPGRMERHYATRLPLRTDATELRAGEALLAFGPEPIPSAVATLNLSPSSDLAEAAANLFAMMRALDRPPSTGIAVMPIPDTGLGQAIRDRLTRAAHQAPLEGGEPIG